MANTLDHKHRWSLETAFNDYVELIIKEDLEDWMEDRGITDHETARQQITDEEWEMWDMASDLDSWLESLTWQYDVDYDYLRNRADILLFENSLRTLEFDGKSKTLN